MLGLSFRYIQLQEKLERFHKFNSYRRLEKKKKLCHTSLVVGVDDACWGLECVELDMQAIEFNVELV